MRGVGVHRHFSRRTSARSIVTVASTSYPTRREPAKRPAFVKCDITSTVGANERTAFKSSPCSFWLSFVQACALSITAIAAPGGTAANASRHEIEGFVGSSGCCPIRRTRFVGLFVRAKSVSTKARSCSASSQYAKPSSRSAIFAASSAHNVDFPAPGAPPTATFRPGTTPPRASESKQSKSTGSSGFVPPTCSTTTPGGGLCSTAGKGSQTDAPQTQNPPEISGR